ncbi:MAG: hypothetical protein C4308_11025 [Chitinophagaceae bacterium]
MQANRYIGFCLFIFFLFFFATTSSAQLGLTFNIPKPKQYEDRTLRSEKSEEKKFTAPRRFVQNTTTHYNYFFNANNKLNEIIARAKEAHKDDYTQLLSFYNYDLEQTARDSVQLDSVIYKATSGIILHDLRSDWADNMYLLWGAAFYLQKKFDSAYLTFQFINYAFAPKEKDGYYLYIGSKYDGNSALSIATKEKNGFVRNMLTKPPSRNDAFIWQIRTFLAQDQFAEAASLIVTLKNDPVFPRRLQNDLEEVIALYYYKQNEWDSAAAHLSQALDNATTKQEKTRWEFLTGQLYEKAGKYDLAKRYYEKAIGHTVDPVMEVYARLNAIRVDKTGGDKFIEKNIDQLLKMAKRDKYTDYRDIIYYMAAQMELERNNIAGAQKLLMKAALYDNGNITQRNRVYLKLATLAFDQKNYKLASNFYDSLQLNNPELKDTAAIRLRRQMLNGIVTQQGILERQDSLQRIAAMPEDERKEFVKKLVKELRKVQGLKDDDKASGGFVTPQTDLFSNLSTKGEWYFYNSSLRAKGASDFKARWGTRPNVDNWRRMSALTAGQLKQARNMEQTRQDILNANQPPLELTFESLYERLPLTEAKMKISNDSIREALFALGKIYAEQAEDCEAVINTYEQLRNRFADFHKMDEVLFRLYYCYSKNGNASKSAEIKSLLSAKYPGSKYTGIVTTGKDPLEDNTRQIATKAYEKIYDLFIEGNFAEAVKQKQQADNLYGQNYWTPQLLYIESVYYIKQRQDSVAMTTLQKIKTNYPNTPLAEKATTLIEVLGRRNQIEEELKNLQVQLPQQPVRRPDTIVSKPVVKADTVVKKPVVQPKVDNKNTQQPKADTITKKTPVLFTFKADALHCVAIVLNKVDVVFSNEAKNAFFRYNREKFYNKTFDLSLAELNADNKLLLIKPFENAEAAIQYLKQAKALAPSEIIPWLMADKYSFTIISEQNLEILKANPDLNAYKNFLEQNLPGRF